MMQVFPIFCDDIRREVGGAPSLMGVYRGALSVEPDNAVIKKLCVHATIVLDENTASSDISLRIEWNGKPIKESEVPKDLVQRLKDEEEDEGGDGEPRFVIVFVAEFYDLDVSGGGTFRTMLSADGRTIEGLPLKVNIIDNKRRNHPQT
ncbi:hypothetical protein H0A70_07935 [Alcaligenaceae bacterium]|nr:hypothetical protein [Alcaligenaceae bacterium]